MPVSLRRRSLAAWRQVLLKGGAEVNHAERYSKRTGGAVSGGAVGYACVPALKLFLLNTWHAWCFGV